MDGKISFDLEKKLHTYTLGLSAPLHNIFYPAPQKGGIYEIFIFLNIDQIQWAPKYTLIWKKMYKHTPWDHPHHPITFLSPFP